jgi:hypothetical protein
VALGVAAAVALAVAAAGILGAFAGPAALPFGANGGGALAKRAATVDPTDVFMRTSSSHPV